MSCVVKNKQFKEAAKRNNVSTELLEAIVYTYINDNSLGGLTGEFPNDSYILELLQGSVNIVTSEELIKLYENNYSEPIVTSTRQEALAVKEEASKYFAPDAIKINQKFDGTYSVKVSEPILESEYKGKSVNKKIYYNIIGKSNNVADDILNALRKEGLVHRYGLGEQYILTLNTEDLFFDGEKNETPTRKDFIERAKNNLILRLKELGLPLSLLKYKDEGGISKVSIDEKVLASVKDAVNLGLPLKDVTTLRNLADFMLDTFAVQFGGIIKKSQAKTMVGDVKTSAFIKDNKVYFVGDDITVDMVAEEFMHPFVNTLYNNSREHFNELYREAVRLFPRLNAEILSAYNKNNKIDYYKGDIRQELVAQALSRNFRVAYERSLIEGPRTSKQVLKELQRTSNFYSKAWKYITALFNHLAEKVLGTKPRFGVEDLKGMTLQQIAELINASDSQFWVNHKDKTRFNLTKDDGLNVHWGSGDNVELSNFAKRPFKIDMKNGFSMTFQSVEQAFQYMKSTYADSAANTDKWRPSKKHINVEIMETDNGATLRALGRLIKGLDVAAWDRDSEKILKELILRSFKQNPQAAKNLLETGEALLTHINKNLTEELRAKNSDKYETLFPKLLMEVREELKAVFPEYVPKMLEQKAEEKKTIKYTPTGKERQTYTIQGEHIYNKEGKEVFVGESVDRNKIFANLAVKENRADVVTYRGHQYVVTDKGEITSVATGNIMKWDDNNGDRKNILALSKVYKDALAKAEKDVTPSITDLIIEHLRNIGITVFGREDIARFLRTNNIKDIQQAIEENKEVAEIKARAIADGTFMKAPNGKPTNLTERQWLQVRTKNFINWFGDWINDPANASKVVNENGEPLVVYHGSPSEFTQFDKNWLGSNTGASSAKLGFFFSKTYEASRSYVGDVGIGEDYFGSFVVIPELEQLLNEIYSELDILDNEYRYDMISKEEYNSSRARLQQILKDKTDKIYEKIRNNNRKVKGNFLNIRNLASYTGTKSNNITHKINDAISKKADGVLLLEVKDPTITDDYIVFEPNQIKSATDNNGEFSTVNDDIQMFIGKKARANFESYIKKNRPDMSDSDIQQALNFLHTLPESKENTAFIKTAIKWIANNSIKLPQDNTKARQAFDLARRKNIDVEKYRTLGELIASDEMKPKEKEKKSFNPDKAKTFSNKRTVTTESGKVFTVYDVENTDEGQKEVCKALAANYSVSPWCLSTFTTTGKPTQSAEIHWEHYNALQRKIAFIDGRPVAFNSDGPSTIPIQYNTIDGYRIPVALEWDFMDGVGKSQFDSETLQYLLDNRYVERNPNFDWAVKEEAYKLTRLGKEKVTLYKEQPQFENRELWWDLTDTSHPALSDDIITDVERLKGIHDNENLEMINNPFAQDPEDRFIINHDISFDINDDFFDNNDAYVQAEHDFLFALENSISSIIGEELGIEFTREVNGHTVWNNDGLDICLLAAQTYMYELNYDLNEILTEDVLSGNTSMIDAVNRVLTEEEVQNLKNNALEYYNKAQQELNESRLRAAETQRESDWDLPFFMTPEGEVYGFVDKNNNIFLDETIITPEHPIHEYCHLWDRIIQQKNPELWNRGVELMKLVPHWNAVANDKNYGKKWESQGITGKELENRIASEVHSRFVGKTGEKVLNELAQQKGKKNIVAKLKEWILEAWKNLKSTFSEWSKEDLDKLTLVDFNRMTVRDFADGVSFGNKSITEQVEQEKKQPLQLKPGNKLLTSIPYNTELVNAIVSATDWVMNGNPEEWYMIEGKAGTGKTTIVKEVLYLVDLEWRKAHNGRGPEIAFGAISHAAVLVLSDSLKTLEKRNVTIDGYTIAQMLGAKMDRETGEFTPNKTEPKIANADIIVVDEASMVNKLSFDLLMAFKRPNAKIIYLGDTGLLPPIESDFNRKGLDSKAFDTKNKSKLLVRVRQGEESPILPYADHFWNEAHNDVHSEEVYKTPVEDIVQKEGAILVARNYRAIEDNLISAFRSAIDSGNYNHIKYICYGNDQRRAINKLIHDKILGSIEDSKTGYSVGDFLVFDNNFGEAKIKSTKGYEPLFYNSENAIIAEISDKINTDKNGITTFLVTLKTNDGKYETIRIPTRDSRDLYYRLLSEIAKKAKSTLDKIERKKIWDIYWNYKETIADVDFGYAITSHKSLGSTYDISIVDERDIYGMNIPAKSKAQSTYVGITRAKKVAVVVNTNVEESTTKDIEEVASNIVSKAVNIIGEGATTKDIVQAIKETEKDVVKQLGGDEMAQAEVQEALSVAATGITFEEALKGQEKFFNETEQLQIKEALDGKKLKVLSVSRYTDPAIYAERVVNFLKENAKKPLTDPTRVVTLELWTKHDGLPIRDILDACEKYRVAPMVSFSITGLGDTALEKGVMKYQDMLSKIKNLINEGVLNPASTTIRIDPILVGVTNIEDIKNIVKTAKDMGIKKFVTSLVLSYGYLDGTSADRKVTSGINAALATEGKTYDWEKYYGTATELDLRESNSFVAKYRSLHPELASMDFKESWKTIVAAGVKDGVRVITRSSVGKIHFLPKIEYIKSVGEVLKELNKDKTIEIETCSFHIDGLKASACLDPFIIEQVTGIDAMDENGQYDRDTSRPECMCYRVHVDLFAWNTKCNSSCAYCYAAHSEDNPINYYNEDGTLRDFDFTRTSREETIEETPKITNNALVEQPKDLSVYTNHSGGALGSDSYWGEIGEQYGVKSNHYYHGSKTPKGNSLQSEEDFSEGKIKAEQASKNMDRIFTSTYVDLLARNWNQVKYSDAVFAIGHIVKAGEKNKKGYNVSKTQVEGGTGYAVQMAIDDNKPVYVFDLEINKWFVWDVTNKDFKETDMPTLTANFAGIGTRELNENGKKAIRDIYAHTMQALREAATPTIDVIRNKLKEQYKEDLGSSKLTDYIFDSLKNSGIRFREDTSLDNSGKFVASENTIYYNPEHIQDNTLLHEAIHAATVYYMKYADKSQLNPEIRQAILEIEECYNLLKEDYIKTHYSGDTEKGIKMLWSIDLQMSNLLALESPIELVAEITKPNVLELIKDFDSRNKDKNIFSRLVDAILRLFNVRKQYNTLESTLKKAMITLITNPNETIRLLYALENKSIKENVKKITALENAIPWDHLDSIIELDKLLSNKSVVETIWKVPNEIARAALEFSTEERGIKNPLTKAHLNSIIKADVKAGTYVFMITGPVVLNEETGNVEIPIKGVSPKFLSTHTFDIKTGENGAAYIDNILELPHIKKANKLLQTELKPVKKFNMTYAYGNNKNSNITADTTIDAIRRGERTATTRYEKHGNIHLYEPLKVGDIIEFDGQKERGDGSVYVRITKPLTKLTEDTNAEEWSRKEGWTVDYFNKNVLPEIQKGEAYQIEFEYVGEATSATNKTIVRLDIKDPIKKVKLLKERCEDAFKNPTSNKIGIEDRYWKEGLYGTKYVSREVYITEAKDKGHFAIIKDTDASKYSIYFEITDKTITEEEKLNLFLAVVDIIPEGCFLSAENEISVDNIADINIFKTLGFLEVGSKEIKTKEGLQTKVPVLLKMSNASVLTRNLDFFARQRAFAQSSDVLFNSRAFTETLLSELCSDMSYWLSGLLQLYSENPELLFNTIKSRRTLDEEGNWTEENKKKDIEKVKSMSHAEMAEFIGIDEIKETLIKGIFFNGNLNPAVMLHLRQVVVATRNLDALLYRAKDTLTQLEKFTIESVTGKQSKIVQKNIIDADGFSKEQDEEYAREMKGDELEHWQTTVRAIDIINDLKQNVRDLFNNIYEVDENNNPIVGTWGVNKRIPLKTIVFSMLSWTEGAKTLSEMITKLEGKSKNNPWVNQIIEKLKDNSGEYSTLLSLIFNDFCKSFLTYSVVVYEKGFFKSKIVNEQPALKLISSSIVADYKLGQHPLFTVTGINKEEYKKFSDNIARLNEIINEGINSTNLDEAAELIGNCSLSLDYTPELNIIKDIISDVNKFKNLVDSLSYILNNITKELDNPDYNPFLFDRKKNPNGIRGNLREFLAPLVSHIEDVTITTVYEDGKMYLSRVMHSYMTLMMAGLRGTNEEFDKFVENTYQISKYGELGWFFKNGECRVPWLRELMGMSAEERQKVFKHKVQLNFSKKGYMKQMSPEEFELSLYTEFFATGIPNSGKAYAWYSVPMLSNKPSSEFIQFKRYVGQNYKESIINDLYDIFEQEASRIQTCKMRKETLKDGKGILKNFDKNGLKFNFLTFLNKFLEPSDSSELGVILKEYVSGIKTDYDKILKLVGEEITTYLDGKATATIQRLKESKMIDAVKQIENVGYTDAEVYDNIENYVWNTFLAKANILELTVGDIAFYKDSDDLQKRLALIHAPSIRPNIEAGWFTGDNPEIKGNYERVSDGIYRSVLLKDIESKKAILSNVIENLEIVFDRRIATATPEMRAGWEAMKERVISAFKEDINVADAQGYNCPSSYRKKAVMFGMWNDFAENVYRKLKNRNYTFADIEVAFQPLKPFVYGMRQEPSRVPNAPILVLGIPTQFKNSEYLLIMADAMLRGEDTGRPNLIKALYDVMEESYNSDRTKGLDTILFESTTKSGLEDTVDLSKFTEDPNGYENAKKALLEAIWGNADHTSDNYRNSVVVEMDYMSYGIQQNVPAHFAEHSLAHGSQGRFITITSLDSHNTDGTPATITFRDGGKERTLTVEEFKKEYEENIALNINEDNEKILKEFGLDKYYLNKLDTNTARAVALFSEIEGSPRYGEDLLWACTIDDNGDFRIPLGDAIQSKRIEQLFNSIIKNRINKQTLPGGPVVQVTNFGLSKRLSIRFKDKSDKSGTKVLDKTAKDFKSIEEYKLYLEDYQGGIAYYECYAPISSKRIFEEFADKNGNIDVAEIEKVNPELLKMVGLRIPTEDKYSMAPLKIVGFLPREAGDGIMLPWEITVITGSDFDVDKFYLMYKNIYLKSKEEALLDKDLMKNLTASVNYKLTTRWGRDLAEAEKNKLQKEILAFVANPQSFKDSKDIIRKLIYKSFLKTLSWEPTKGRAYRDNKIIDMTWAVLTNESEVEKILTPQGFDEEKKVAYAIKAFKNKITELKQQKFELKEIDLLDTWNTLLAKSTEELKKMSSEERNLCLDYDNVLYYALNKAASTLLGMFAVQKIAHAVLEGNELYVDFDALKVPKFKLFGTVYGGEEPVCFTNEFNKKGFRIGKSFGNLVGAAADAVKDPILNLIQINNMTAPVLATMLKFKMSFEEASLLLSLNEVTKILKECSLTNIQGFTTLTEVINNRIKELESKLDNPSITNGVQFDYEKLFDEDFSLERALEGLSEDASEKVKYQGLVILKRLLTVADAIKGPTFATRFNSISNAVGPLAVDNLLLEYQINKPYEGITNKSGKVLYKNAEDIFKKHPILKAFANSVNTAEKLLDGVVVNSEGFRSLLDIKDNDDFPKNDIYNDARVALRETIYGNRDLLNKLADFYSSYLLLLSGAIDESKLKYYIEEFPKKFFDKDNGYKKQYAGNTLIDAIKPGETRENRISLDLDISGLKESEKEVYKSAWSDLYNVNPLLAEDLFVYNFFRAGNVFSPKTFISLLPPRLKEKLFLDNETGESKYISAYKRISSLNRYERNNRLIIDQFIRNNADNPKLVKKIKFNGDPTKDVIYIGNTRLIRNMYIMISQNGVDYLFRLKGEVPGKYVIYDKVDILGGNKEFFEVSLQDIKNSQMPIKNISKSETSQEGDVTSEEDYISGENNINSNVITDEQRSYDLQLLAVEYKRITGNEVKANNKTLDNVISSIEDIFKDRGLDFNRELFMEELNKFC